MHAMIRRLALLPLLAAQVPVVLTDVTWDSPAAGDVYIPGDTLQAVWTSPAKVVSPSFTICIADNSTNANVAADCGTAVWPSVEQNGTEYSISMAVPNITGNGDYYLLMKDDSGTVYDTPNFSLSLTKVANSTANATASSSSSIAQPTSTSIAYLPSHPAPTAAAIAIPLSLVAVTLLGALLLLLCRSRRSRRREKDKLKEIRDAEKLRSRESTISFASATEIERAVWALAATRGYGGPGPGPGPYTHAPLHTSMSGPFGGQEMGAAAAAALGMGAFGWAHAGFRHAPPVVPAMHDAYTPAPVRTHGMGPTTSFGSRPHNTYTTAGLLADGNNPDPAPALAPASQVNPRPQAECMHLEQETGRRPVNWHETDWRGTDRMFADEPVHSMFQSSGPPQLPAIQLHASSSPPHVHHTSPPPLPPKELFPGSPQAHAPRAYSPPYSPSPASAPEPRLMQTPGADSNASLNVLSNYFQLSPSLPQGQYLAPPDPNDHISDVPVPRVPPASLTRARSLRRLETVPGHAENEKALPVRPEDRVGTDLYGAVSRAVGR